MGMVALALAVVCRRCESGSMTARLLTWNLERKKPTNPRGVEALDHVFGLDADVMVLTEARTSIPMRGGHARWCEPPLGTRFGADERKIVMWSKQPWTSIDRVGVQGLDDTRFIAASTQTPIGELRVLGICIPWHMAEVTYPTGEKHKPWELHIRYLELLTELLADTDGQTVISGDFNQQVPRIAYGRRDAAAALVKAFAPVDIVTSGVVDGVSRPGIDHIALAGGLTATRVWGWPNDVNGNRLSDHDGAACELALV